jgi:ribonuclease Y
VDPILIPFFALFLVGGGLILGITVHKKKLKATFDKAQLDSQKVLEEAQGERERIIKDAYNEAKQENRERRDQFDNEFKKRRAEMQKLEQKIKLREQALEKKLSVLDKKEADLEKMSGHLQDEESKYKRLVKDCESSLDQHRRTLESIAKLSQEDAKKELVRSLESEAKKEARETVKKIEDDAREEALKRARSMVSLAVQRVSSEYVNDTTVAVVGLPSDEMKGRIIGREGRNIRAIEQTTGVDLIIDDTPEAVILSCFNPIRREIAKISLERLIADGRIHPARIEETVRKVEKEFEQIIFENGEQAAFDTGITDLPAELIRVVGKLKFRTAGQQTVLQHSVEVAHICGIMAAEMKLDVRKAKRAGLLHDIGKAVDQETEGHHAAIGADLLRKFNESDEIIEAVQSHHNEELTSARPLTVVLHAANMLSANRPGARRETLETYVKRLQNMEDLVKGFNGIESCFVMQAGREIRAIVTPTDVSDTDVTHLSNDIAFKLRTEMQFPGQVMVTVVREAKFVDFAK